MLFVLTQVRSVLLISGVLALVVLGAGGYVLHAVLSGNGENATGQGEPVVTQQLRVTAVTPHKNAGELLRTVTQPAYVQGMYKAELMARVAGRVKKVLVNIGDEVREGDVLIEIEVPDLEQEVKQKSAQLKLAEREVKSAQANVKAMEAQSREARELIGEREADVERMEAKRKYHEAMYQRVRSLARQNVVDAALVDDRLKNYEAAVADHKSAVRGVASARANAEEFGSKVDATVADVEVKQARVEAARADLEKSATMLSFATITAPFSGQVTGRRVDPGSFVQNASTGSPLPLLTLVKMDEVTLVMWVPERESLLVSRNTEAVIHLDAARDLSLRGKVSRYSNLLDAEKSRDMRVEVDLPNRDKSCELKVGMYGSMTLILRRFQNAYLLPASAVFVRAGRTWICEVRDGRAALVPVRVEMEDGIRVKVVKLVSRLDPTTRLTAEVVEDMRGDEVVVRSGQGEIRDGQEVQVNIAEW